MLRRWALVCVLGTAVAACGSGGPSYLRVTVTCDDPLVDLALVESLTVRWTLDTVQPQVDVPVGDVLRDGSTSFVLQMPGGVTVTGLTAEGTGPGGAVLATAAVDAVEVPGSGTRDVTLALGAPAGPRPLTCTGGGAPTTFPTVRVTDALEHSKAESVTWMGTGWAVSFGDARFNEPDKSRTDPMLALLAPDGTKLGDEVRVDDGWCYAAASQVAWTGSRLAVAWYDCSPSPEGDNYDLMFRAFDASGAPLGPTKVLTQAVAQNENWRTGTLLWDGSRLVLASAYLPGAGPDWQLVLWLLDEDGNLVDELRRLDSSGPDETLPALAYSGSGYALGFNVKEGAASVGRLLLLTPGGHATGGVFDIGVGNGLSLVWAGDRYVAGQVDATGTTPHLRLVSIGADGSIGQPLVLPLTDLALGFVPLASTGSDLGALVTYRTTESVVGVALQRYAAWLAPVGGATVVREEGAGAVSLLALGASPTGYGLAWSDDSAGNWEVFFAAVGCP
ncbi:MAG: hypothetical protein HY906_15825 [Deltaproteobacteria bacterium]|nr:hypothetical protein [Deltaproteobacteria bacterium]